MLVKVSCRFINVVHPIQCVTPKYAQFWCYHLGIWNMFGILCISEFGHLVYASGWKTARVVVHIFSNRALGGVGWGGILTFIVLAYSRHIIAFDWYVLFSGFGWCGVGSAFFPCTHIRHVAFVSWSCFDIATLCMYIYIYAGDLWICLNINKNK